MNSNRLQSDLQEHEALFCFVKRFVHRLFIWTHQIQNKLLLQEEVAMAVFIRLILYGEDSIRPYTPTSFTKRGSFIRERGRRRILPFVVKQNPPKRELMNDNCAIFSAACLAFSICYVLILRHRLFFRIKLYSIFYNVWRLIFFPVQLLKLTNHKRKPFLDHFGTLSANFPLLIKFKLEEYLSVNWSIAYE